MTRWRRATPTRAVVLVGLLAGLLVGCGSTRSGSGSGGVAPDYGASGPTHASLLRAARLAPCPASTATPAVGSGGLPSLTLPCLGSGPAVHLAGLSGRPTVVNVWGSWCGPCQKEIPYLDQVYDAARSRVRFLGVDIVDSDDSALSFAAHVEPAMHYPSVVDHDRTTLLRLELPPSPPVTVFVSAAGRIVSVKHGAYPSAAALRADISSYLHVSA